MSWKLIEKGLKRFLKVEHGLHSQIISFTEAKDSPKCKLTKADITLKWDGNITGYNNQYRILEHFTIQGSLGNVYTYFEIMVHMMPILWSIILILMTYRHVQLQWKIMYLG